jgi:hypothetical protein
MQPIAPAQQNCATGDIYGTSRLRQIPAHFVPTKECWNTAESGISCSHMPCPMGSSGMKLTLGKMARSLVIGVLNWAAEWWEPNRDWVNVIISAAQTLVSIGRTPS